MPAVTAAAREGMELAASVVVTVVWSVSVSTWMTLLKLLPTAAVPLFLTVAFSVAAEPAIGVPGLGHASVEMMRSGCCSTHVFEDGVPHEPVVQV
jgi:hypothetical protein